jgi:Protein of unknown function (DUF2750)
MKITEKELEHVSALEPYERYKYTIKRSVDNELFYSLKSKDGDWALSTVKERDLFPIWPFPEYAKSALVDGWANSDIVEVTLLTFQDELIQLIREAEFLINVFPIGANTGFVVTLDEFIRDIGDEMTLYQ